MKKQLTVALSLALLGGCAIGPDYESVLPDAPGQSAFVNYNDDLMNNGSPEQQWWHLYDDDTLNTLVTEALSANADLQAAAANLRRAEAVWNESRNRQLPSTTVNASETYSQQNFFFGDTPLTAQNSVYNVSLDISYQLDLFGQVRRAIEAARADSQATEATLLATSLTVVASTVRSYAAICHGGHQLALANENIELQKERVDLTRRLLEAGRGTAMILATAEAQLAQTQALLPMLQSNRQAALYQLTALLGRTPQQVPEAALACTSPLAVTRQIPIGDGAELLRRRPDVLQAERQLAAATARVGVSLGDYLPTVSFVAGIGSAAESGADLFNGETETWNYGPVISWNFPNILGTRARVRQAEASVDSALASFNGTWLNALRETETALSSYLFSLQRLDALGRASDRHQEAARLAQLRFDAGQLNYLDLLQAELNAITASTAEAAAKAESTALQVDLFLALGGSWPG